MGDIRLEVDSCFQEWVLLAREDPEAFEQKRRLAIDQFLSTSSDRHRALGATLQREIDAVRNRAGNAQSAFPALARMLCQQLDFLCDGLNDLREDLGMLAPYDG